MRRVRECTLAQTESLSQVCGTGRVRMCAVDSAQARGGTRHLGERAHVHRRDSARRALTSLPSTHTHTEAKNDNKKQAAISECTASFLAGPKFEWPCATVRRASDSVVGYQRRRRRDLRGVLHLAALKPADVYVGGETHQGAEKRNADENVSAFATRKGFMTSHALHVIVDTVPSRHTNTVPAPPPKAEHATAHPRLS